MTIEQIRKVHGTRPFRAFRLRTADGREYSVQHPEFLYITPTGRTIVVADRDGNVDIVDLLLMATIHFDRGSRRGDGRAQR